MNDLMTKSFLSYVDLKKQAMNDLGPEPDIEMGKLDPADEQHLASFFEEVNAIKTDMEEITNLLLDLQDLNEETKSTHSLKILRGLRDRINSDMVTILRKAKNIKERLGSLDESNVENRRISDGYKEGTPIDRTRISVTSGLRIKLRDMMNDFQSLREQIVKDHRDCLRRRYFNATGEEPSDEVIEKMVVGGGGGGGEQQQQVKVFEGKEDLVMENQERYEALKEIQRSLTELHQLFLDMAVLVETQEEQVNDIERNVAQAGDYINGGTKKLDSAKKLKKKSMKWVYFVVALIILLLLISFISISVS